MNQRGLYGALVLHPVLLWRFVMITIPQPKYRKRRRTRLPKDGAPVVVGPVLVVATYDPGVPSVTLTFDRAIDASGIVAGAITVFDGERGVVVFNTTDFVIVSPEAVQVIGVDDGGFPGAGVTMSATGATGIVDDSTTPWAGVAGIELPYP